MLEELLFDAHQAPCVCDDDAPLPVNPLHSSVPGETTLEDGSFIGS